MCASQPRSSSSGDDRAAQSAAPQRKGSAVRAKERFSTEPAIQRHLFYVHSHLTYIVACSVAETEQLRPDEVLFLLGRGYRTPDVRFRMVELSGDQCALASVPTYGERLLLLRRASALRSIDRMLADFAGEKLFAAYLPSTRNFLMQFLATHPRCGAVHLLEEGLMTHTGGALKPHNSYYSQTVVGRLKRWCKFLDHGNRSTYYLPWKWASEPILYAVSHELAAACPSQRVRVLERLAVPDIPQCYILSGASVFFADRIVEWGFTSAEMVARILLLVGERLGGDGTLWIKWHPAQKAQEGVMRILDRAGMHYNVIPSTVAAESMLLKSRDMTVYGFHSSLLYYAALWGHRAVSLLKVLERLDPGFLRRHARLNLPETFFRRVSVPEDLSPGQ